ncbi:MAG: thiamine biosynthesis protein ThiF [Gemmataceae bacterium]
MAHVIQVGAGSGGMVVLDLLAHDPRIHKLTLIEPDVFKPHNAERHYFPATCAGRLKVQLAAQWLHERRADLLVETLPWDILDPQIQADLAERVAEADLGVCAVDNEAAKFCFDSLMRRQRKPWTLGEVLSGGIGGFVHRFVPDGPCYGCVASYLQRSVEAEKPRTDYADPAGAQAALRIPANKAAIFAIASWHALLTLQLLDPSADRCSTTLLVALQKVDGIFDEAPRVHRFCVPRLETCLLCGPPSQSEMPARADDLDRALHEALSRLEHPG